MLTHSHEVERLSPDMVMCHLRWAAPGLTVALDVPWWERGTERSAWSVKAGASGGAVDEADEFAARAAAAAECRRLAAALLEAAAALEDGGEG